MCCSSSATKDAAATIPVTLEAPSNDAVKNIVVTPSRRFGVARPLPRASSSARRNALAVRRAAPRVINTRVTREDLDSVRVALEQELATGRPCSDAEIIERVSSRKRQHHPLVISIGKRSELC